MGRVRDQVGACTCCGEAFRPTRQRQERCQGCRRRLAMKRHAAKRLTQLQPMLTALDNLRLWMVAEIERWERITGGD